MEELVQQIIAGVGSLNNIKSCTNCLTRLSIVLNDSSEADHKQIQEIKGVFDIIEEDTQLLIVVGPSKAKKATIMLNKLIESSLNPVEEPAEKKPKQQSRFHQYDDFLLGC